MHLVLQIRLYQVPGTIQLDGSLLTHGCPRASDYIIGSRLQFMFLSCVMYEDPRSSIKWPEYVRSRYWTGTVFLGLERNKALNDPQSHSASDMSLSTFQCAVSDTETPPSYSTSSRSVRYWGSGVEQPVHHHVLSSITGLQNVN